MMKFTHFAFTLLPRFWMGCAEVMTTTKIPERVILTDDSIRARVLIAHHLEYSVPLIEQGDFFVFTGKYHGIPLAVVSSGFGNKEFRECLTKLKEMGAKQIVYLSTCISTAKMYDIRSLIIGAGGSRKLIDAAQKTIKRTRTQGDNPTKSNPARSNPAKGSSTVREIQMDGTAVRKRIDSSEFINYGTVQAATVYRMKNDHPGEGCIINDATAILYEQATLNKFDVLSILTVSENMATGNKMDENEARSRLYPASSLVFELWTVS